jgi:sugar/nucleoside kinase (ribokinase family)
MPNLLFIGDINVDILMGGLASLPIVDKEITCQSFQIAVGSSAVIAAAAYASLGGGGGNASFLGLAGNDDYGNFMLRSMNELNINTNLVRRTNAVNTGVTVNLIHQSTRTQITYPGTIAEFNGADITGKDLHGFDHIHFAGPYLQTNFRPHLTRLLQLAKSKNITTSLDPQWDPAETWLYMNDWLPLLTYLFVNEGEALSITRANSLEDAARQLATKTRTPILKAGPQGSLALHHNQLLTAPAKKIPVVDTTGAGDCFDAGFLFATLEKKLPLQDALAFANATGSRSCTFPGGVAHKSSYNDILNFLSTDAPPTGTATVRER